jgi:hypothetical protein
MTAAAPRENDRALIRAFITSEPLTRDWVQPGSQDRADSPKDLSDGFARSRIVRVVPGRTEADIVIEITGREATQNGRTVVVYSGDVAVAKRLQGRSVAATVRVADQEFKFVGSTNRRYWSAAAEDLATDIERWAKANADRILGLRVAR